MKAQVSQHTFDIFVSFKHFVISLVFQVWRQMRYYFGWMEENKIVRPVPESTDRFQFHEKFYREKFLPYKFRSAVSNIPISPIC